MTVQELLDKLQEIKAITLDLPMQEHLADNNRIVQIQQICDDALLLHKIEKGLRNVSKLRQE